jgi:hypothetical protein
MSNGCTFSCGLGDPSGEPLSLRCMQPNWFTRPTSKPVANDLAYCADTCQCYAAVPAQLLALACQCKQRRPDTSQACHAPDLPAHLAKHLVATNLEALLNLRQAQNNACPLANSLWSIQPRHHPLAGMCLRKLLQPARLGADLSSVVECAQAVDRNPHRKIFIVIIVPCFRSDTYKMSVTCVMKWNLRSALWQR